MFRNISLSNSLFSRVGCMATVSRAFTSIFRLCYNYIFSFTQLVNPSGLAARSRVINSLRHLDWLGKTRARHGRLVKVESNEENDFITRELLANGAAYWIGLFKFCAGVREWTDGTQLNGYENWRDGQPNNNNLNCGQIRKGTVQSNDYDGHWRWKVRKQKEIHL